MSSSLAEACHGATASCSSAWRAGLLRAALVVLSAASFASGQLDPHAVVGPDSCTECHESETAVWKDSRHVLGGKSLTRNDAAKAIAKALGVRRIKSDERCMSCHFTPGHSSSGRLSSVAEVSCESCHGAASDWVDVHNDYGGAATAAEEAHAHRTERFAACDAAGMGRPGRVVGIADRCYSCHVIADAELIEKGGHPLPRALELLAGSQGEVRHNFVRGKGANVEATAKRKRVLYVVGRALLLEYALRGQAGASAEGVYADHIASLRAEAVEHLKAIEAAVPEIRFTQLLEGVAAGAGDAFVKAADSVRKQIEAFELAHDGEALAALDGLLPTAAEYVGSVHP